MTLLVLTLVFRYHLQVLHPGPQDRSDGTLNQFQAVGRRYVMFSTDDGAEVPCPFSGIRLWANVTRHIHAPWFHVVVEGESDGITCSRMVLLSHIEQLRQMSEIPEVRILEVGLVSPSYINGTLRWQMDPLREVWIGIEPDESQEATIFVLESGVHYSYSDSGFRTPPDKLRKDQLIFRMPTAPYRTYLGTGQS